MLKKLGGSLRVSSHKSEESAEAGTMSCEQTEKARLLSKANAHISTNGNLSLWPTAKWKNPLRKMLNWTKVSTTLILP